MKKLLAIILSSCIMFSCLGLTVFAEGTRVKEYSLFGKAANTQLLQSRDDEIEIVQYALNEYVRHLHIKRDPNVKYEPMTTPLTKGCDAFTNDLFYAITTVYGGYWEASLETATYSDGTVKNTYVYSNSNGVTVRYYDDLPDDIFITYMGMSLFPYAYKTGKHTEVIDKNYMELYNLCRSVVDECRKGAETDDILFEKRVHDWVCERLVYDNTLTVFTAERALKGGTGVCQAYAELFQLLLKMGGVDCWYVWGTARNSAGTLQKHAWNCVKLNGKYYYVDTTWDDVNEDSIKEFKSVYSAYSPFTVITEQDERRYDTRYLIGYNGNSWAKINYDYRYLYFDRGYNTMSVDHFMWTDDYILFYN